MTSQPSTSQVDAEQSEPLKKRTVLVFSPEVSSYFIAGGFAGAASRTVVSPLERLKIIQSVVPLTVSGLLMICSTF